VRTDKMDMLNQLWAATAASTEVAGGGTTGSGGSGSGGDPTPLPVDTGSAGSTPTETNTGGSTPSDVGSGTAPQTGAGAVDLPLMLFCVGLAACARRQRWVQHA